MIEACLTHKTFVKVYIYKHNSNITEIHTPIFPLFHILSDRIVDEKNHFWFIYFFFRCLSGYQILPLWFILITSPFKNYFPLQWVKNQRNSYCTFFFSVILSDRCVYELFQFFLMYFIFISNVCHSNQDRVIDLQRLSILTRIISPFSLYHISDISYNVSIFLSICPIYCDLNIKTQFQTYFGKTIKFWVVIN